MTTRDKTRDKLLSSMRKTKQVMGDQPDTRQAHAKTYAAAAPKPATPATPAESETVSERPSTRPQLASDPYQSRGRVWPD